MSIANAASSGLVTSATPAAQMRPAILRPIDLGLFLIGDRGAILRCVSARYGWLLGASLVLIAAIGREYDGTSFLYQPAEILPPFAASIILASVLYCVIQLFRKIGGAQLSSPGRDYVELLTGYWLTAPLAWIYAVPIEQWGSDKTALYTNLSFLTLVSLWRVLLFSRVASVITQVSYWMTLSWIGTVCALVAFFGLIVSHFTLIGVMGGVRLTETERIMYIFHSVATTVCGWGFVVFLILTCLSLILLRRNHSNIVLERLPTVIGWSNIGLVVCAAILSLVGLVLFQPSLYHAEVVNRHIFSEEYAEAIHYMSDHDEQSFPKMWYPLGKQWPNQTWLDLNRLIATVEATRPPRWVAARLLRSTPDRLITQINRSHFRATDDRDRIQRLDSAGRRMLLDTLLNLKSIGCLEGRDAKLVEEWLAILDQLASDEPKKEEKRDKQ